MGGCALRLGALTVLFSQQYPPVHARKAQPRGPLENDSSLLMRLL